MWKVGCRACELVTVSHKAQRSVWCEKFCFFMTAEKGGVARAKGVEEKEKECTTECKSQRRLDETAPWAPNYGVLLQLKREE